MQSSCNIEQHPLYVYPKSNMSRIWVSTFMIDITAGTLNRLIARTRKISLQRYTSKRMQMGNQRSTRWRNMRKHSRSVAYLKKNGITSLAPVAVPNETPSNIAFVSAVESIQFASDGWPRWPSAIRIPKNSLSVSCLSHKRFQTSAICCTFFTRVCKHYDSMTTFNYFNVKMPWWIRYLKTKVCFEEISFFLQCLNDRASCLLEQTKRHRAGMRHSACVF